MAQNDYTISVGLDSTSALQGIATLETKLKGIAQANDKLRKPRKVSTAARANEIKSTIRKGLARKQKNDLRIQKQVNVQMDKYKNSLRSVDNQIKSMDMTAKNATGDKKRLQGVRREIKEQQNAMTNAAVTTEAGLRKFSNSWGTLQHKIKDVTTEVKRTNKQLSVTRQLMNGFKMNLMQYGFSALSVGAIQLTGALYQNSKEWESLRIQMQASFGSAEEGEKQMTFLTDTARTLGLDVKQLADGYAKIGATGTMVGLSTEQIKEVFLGASEAATAFGLSVDDTQGVMRAFSQMLGKGQVMAEELKQQLGDRFPIAMGVMAKAIGKTVPELIELMEAGELSTAEVLKFSTELRKNVRESGAYQKSLNRTEAAQNRFNLAMSQAGDAFMGGGMNNAIKEFFETFEEFFTETKGFWKFLGDILGGLLYTGLMLMKTVIAPMQQALRGIGLIWDSLSNVALTKSEDVSNLNYMERSIRVMYLMFVDIWIMMKRIGLAWDYVFGEQGRMDFLDALFGYLKRIDDWKASGESFVGFSDNSDKKQEGGSYWERVKNSLGMESKIGNPKYDKWGDEKGKSIAVAGDINVYAPPGTPPKQYPEIVSAIANKNLDSQISGQMADSR